jgi:hypothetical protein
VSGSASDASGELASVKAVNPTATTAAQRRGGYRSIASIDATATITINKME